MWFLALSYISLSFLIYTASGVPLSPYVLHERRSSLPAGWSKVRKPSVMLPLRFGLAQASIDQLDAYLHAVSHPDSPDYGKHWSAGDVARVFAPAQETVATVFEWLQEELPERRVRLSKNKGWIEVNVTVEEAERLLQTEYHVYGHEGTGSEHIACEAYHLPAHVQPYVDLVLPTVHFDAILKKRGSGPAHNVGQPGTGPVSPKTTGMVEQLFTQLENCDQQITPLCLRTLYGLVYEPLSGAKNSYGIVEYTPQAYVQSDLNMFFANFSSSLVGVSPQMVSIDGGIVQNLSQSFGYNLESNLDLQYAMSLVTASQPVTLYQTGDLIEGASFNNLLDALDGSYCTFEGGDNPYEDGIYPDPYSNYTGAYEGPEACGTVTPANVISTSYGNNEADLLPAYAARQCAEYAKLGLMGVTVLYSSGDYGVSGDMGECLVGTDGAQRFSPSFPGTCPYVTSVGATQVNPNSTVFEPESACEQVIYSGGGFSNYFAMPEYQKTAVEAYFAHHKPPYSSAQYNDSMQSRGYPDIAANGANYIIALEGEYWLAFGTSASSPVVGAILTMVNDARLAIGKKPVGFINPTLYSDSWMLNDITSGTNEGCGTEGFSAVPGWDPVTGLGTPNFPKMLARWLLLP